MRTEGKPHDGAKQDQVGKTGGRFFIRPLTPQTVSPGNTPLPETTGRKKSRLQTYFFLYTSCRTGNSSPDVPEQSNQLAASRKVLQKAPPAECMNN
jgi:hypothetical protein